MTTVHCDALPPVDNGDFSLVRHRLYNSDQRLVSAVEAELSDLKTQLQDVRFTLADTERELLASNKELDATKEELMASKALLDKFQHLNHQLRMMWEFGSRPPASVKEVTSDKFIPPCADMDGHMDGGDDVTVVTDTMPPPLKRARKNKSEKIDEQLSSLAAEAGLWEYDLREGGFDRLYMYAKKTKSVMSETEKELLVLQFEELMQRARNYLNLEPKKRGPVPKGHVWRGTSKAGHLEKASDTNP